MTALTDLTLTQARGRDVFDLFLALDPAVAGDQHVGVFGDNQLFFAEFLLACDFLNLGAALGFLYDGRMPHEFS